MEKLSRKTRQVMGAVLGSEALFLFAAFLLRGILNVETFKWYLEGFSYLYAYVLCPWGGALIALRLSRIERGLQQAGWEQKILFFLLLWISVPFLYRFGPTFNNVVTMTGYAMVFFGIYASLSEREMKARRKQLKVLSCLFCLLSLVWGGALLYCAWTGNIFGEADSLVFGVRRGMLWAGVHYNSVGMMALCTLFMCLAAVEVFRKWPLRALGVLSAVIMVLVIILSQSRTARYAMLLGLAAGTFGLVLYWKRTRKGILLAAGLSACVLISGYLACSAITRLALHHYEVLEGAPSKGMAVLVTQAQAESRWESTGKERVAVDATFSDRTNVWNNLFDLWKSEPEKLIIGRGVGNTGSLIAHGTSHEVDGTASVHNTFLQFIADFGLIGFALQALFLGLTIVWALRAFFAPVPEKGVFSMAMLVAALMATGMMESAPLGQMTPTCLCLYFALAYLRMPE